DFQLVEGEAAQIVQARITGAEVVQCQAYAERLEAEHGELGGIDVADEGAFRDLELETAGVESGLGQNALDHVYEIDATKLQGRDVHRNRDSRPGFAIQAGATQHQLTERDDQTAVLGDRNELAGRDLAA